MGILDKILGGQTEDQGQVQAPDQQPQVAVAATGDNQSPILRRILNPIGTQLDESLQRGQSWDQTSERIKDLGANPDDYADKKKYFDLANKKKELESSGLSFSQAYRGSGGYQPFGSLLTVPESVARPLDYVSREIGRLGGKEQDIGGRVVGNSEYQQATQKFQAGQATPDDIEAIATYERHAQIRSAIHKGANFGQSLVFSLGSLGTLSAETMTGQRVLAGAAKLALPARAAPAAIAGVAPAVPQLSSMGARLATGATNLGISTAVAPSMYVPMMQQSNMAAGRDANDFRGLPTAFGYAYANMLVLGRMSGGRGVESTIAGNAFKKGILGVAETQSVDLAAGVADEFLPKAYQIKPDEERYGNVGMWLRANRAGDVGKQSEVLRDTSVQALSFGLFAAVHGREAKATDLMQSYADTIGKMQSNGMTKTRAAEVIGEQHVKLEDALSKDPYLSREAAREVLSKDVPSELNDYVEKLADTFEPQAKLPTQSEVHKTIPKPPEPTPEPTPEVAAAATKPPEPGQPPTAPVTAAVTGAAPKPGDVVQAEGRKPADLSTVVSVDPTEPNPNRRVTVEHSDLTQEKVGVDAIAPKPPLAPTAPLPEKPTVLGTGTTPTARQKVGQLEIRNRELDAKILETDRAATAAESNAKTGGNPAIAKTLRREHGKLIREQKALVKELEPLRTQALLEELKARQPLPAAATPPEAPSVPPEALKIQPTQTPTEPTNAAAAATVAPAAGEYWAYDGTRHPDAKVDDLASHMSQSTYNLAKRLGRPEEDARNLARDTYVKQAFGEEEAPAAVAPNENTPQGIIDYLHSRIDTTANLTPAMRTYYKASISKAISSLPAAAATRLGANLKGTKFYSNPRDAAMAHTRERLDDPDLTPDERMKWMAHLAKFESGVHSAVGAFNDKTGTLYIDGAAHVGRELGVHGYEGTLEASQIAGHEFGHTLDGPDHEFSSDPKFTSAYISEIGSAKHRVSDNPPLTKYATTSRAEGFAEFCRLLYATDVPTEQIAKEFPKTSKFFKDRDLWPAERAGKAEPIKEVFNERIGDETSHIDAKNESKTEVAAAATPEPAKPEPTPAPKSKVRKPRAGEAKKPATVEVEPASDWRKIDPVEGGDMGADRRVMGQFIKKFKDNPQAKDAIEEVLHNMKSVDNWLDLHGKERRRNTLGSLTSTLARREKDGDTEAIKALRQVIEHFGGKFTEEQGAIVPYNFFVHEFEGGRPPGIDTGSPAKVVRQGVQIWNDGKYNRSNIADNAEGEWETVQKAVVEPIPEKTIVAAAATKAGAAKSESKPEAKKEPSKEELQKFFQDQFDSMDADEKRALRADPVQKKLYEDNGVNIYAKERTNREGVKGHAVEGLESYIDEVKSNDKLSSAERISLIGTLQGKGQRDIASGLGVSHTMIQKYLKRALDKMRSHSTSWEDFKTLQDVIDAGMVEAKRLKEASANDYRMAQSEKEQGANPAENFQELRIKSLAAIFDSTRAGGRSLWQRLSGLFFGNLPTSARAAKEQEIDGQIAAYSFDVKNAAADFRTALKTEHKPYEQLSKSELKNLDMVLRSDKAARTGIGPKTLAALDTMRNQVRKLSDKLVDVGAIDGPLIATVEANRDEYLTRQYQVFTDPAWEAKVYKDLSIVNRFKSWLTNELIASGKTATPEEVDAITKSLLRDGTAAENPIAFLKKSLLGSKDLSILKARKDIPEELRALWGEYEDPLVNYTNSVAKMAHLLTAHQFLTRVTGEGFGKFFFDKPTVNSDGEHVHSISDEGNPAYSPLAGKYMTKELKEALQDQFSKKNLGWGMQWYMKALAAAKFNKVILSHVGQIHNFMSNVFIAVRNGHFNIAKAPAALRDVFSNSEKGRDYWRKLITLGVVGEGIHYNDFQRTIADAMGGREHFGGIDSGTSKIANSMLGRMLRTGAKRAAALYNYGDAIWKVYGFENEKAKYQAAGLSESQAEAKAAQIVRDTMPTYSKIAPGLQALRRSPIVAPFIAFQAEMVRTTKNNLKLAISELKDPNTRAIGATRLAGMAAAATLPIALAAATRAMFGVDDSEEKALRRFLPDWQKNSRLVYFGRDPKTGHPKYADLSKIDPHAYLSDGMIAFIQGKDSADGFKKAVDEWKKPFTQEELLLRPALDIARNQKEPGGNVYNPQADSLTQTADIGQHVGQAFVPAAYGPIRRMGKALLGSAEQKSGKEYNVQDTAIEQAGVRIESPRVREDLANKARGFEEAKKQADKMVQDMIHAKGSVSPQDLKSARDATEEARKRTMDDFRQDVDAAERLGVPRREIAAILRSSGVSILEIGQLFSATQVPYQPKLQGTATERERAGQVRKLGGTSLQP